jgi:hypothetical protein
MNKLIAKTHPKPLIIKFKIENNCRIQQKINFFERNPLVSLKRAELQARAYKLTNSQN